MEQTIVECHDSCESLFEELIEAMRNPECDFGEQLSPAIIKEEYGRFKVWRGNVSAHHDISRRISLDYRLRDSKFYRDKIIRHLNDLSAALNSCKSSNPSGNALASVEHGSWIVNSYEADVINRSPARAWRETAYR